MPQLLLELFSEEIPARMQRQAARDLERMVRERLAAEGFLPEGLTTFAGPRRLTLVAEGIEEEAQASELRRLGCDEGQGFLFWRPMPANAVDGLLAEAGLPPVTAAAARRTGPRVI